MLLGVLGGVFVATVGTGGWVGWRFWRLSRDPMGEAGGVRLVYSVNVDRSWEPGHRRRDVVRRTADAVRQRIEPYNRYAAVADRRGNIEVDLPTVGQKLPVDVLQTQIARSGRLAFQLVDDGSAFMRNAANHLHRLSLPGVAVQPESWTGASGESHEDLFLAGAQKEQLVAAIEAITTVEAVPEGHELLLEQRESDWRTYYAFSESHLDNADLRSADTSWAQDTGRPEVAIDLTPEGARKLLDLTDRSLGRKMAIVFEGRVMMAPVIISRIPNGRVRITLAGGRDAFVVFQEAKDLVAVLRFLPLPAPIDLLTAERVVPRR